MSLATFSLVRTGPVADRLGIFPVALTVALTSVPLGVLAFQALRSSYLEYLSNGPGGVGQHVIGWCQVLVLRFGLWAFGVKDQDVSIYKKMVAAGESRKWLSEDLPQRDGARPALKLFPLPQRQLVDQQDELLGAAQLAILSNLAEEYPKKAFLQNSILEGFGPGLFVHPTVTVDPGVLPNNHRREFAHIHLAPYSFPTPLPKVTSVRFSMTNIPEAEPDPAYHAQPLPGPQSMHVTLAPKDAILVIEKGWGVRHPASGEPPLGVPRLAAGYVLTYAPRNGDELAVLKLIVAASAAYVAGTKGPAD